ncbi:MAG: hypothetical protein U0794_17565 [Isosphaeraceae bacterium]
MNPALSQPDSSADVLHRLENTATRWWTCSFWTGLCATLALSVGGLTLFALIDAWVHLSQSSLGFALACWVLVSLGALGWLFFRLLRFQRGLSATARRVEVEIPEVGSSLINLVQLASSDATGPDAWRKAAMRQAAADVSGVAFERAADRLSRRRRLALCMQNPRDFAEASVALAATVVVAMMAAWFVPGWTTATRRLMTPWAFVPATGSVSIRSITPGDVEVLVGSSLSIAATIDKPTGRTLPARLFVRRPGESETSSPMHADRDGITFHGALPEVVDALAYRVEVGDSQSPLYRVGVYRRPSVASVVVTYDYPEYLARASQTRKQREGDLEAPPLTRATLRVGSTTPIDRGYLMLGSVRIPASVDPDRSTLVAELLLTEHQTYTIHLIAPGDHSDPQPRINRIRIESDAPPTVAILEPAPDADTALGATLPVVVRAGDDNGLGEVRVELAAGADMVDPSPRLVTRWSTFLDPQHALLTQPLILDTASYRAGTVLQIRAVARDRRDVRLGSSHLAPQETSTPWQRLRIVAPETRAKETLARLDSIRESLVTILRRQVEARTTSSTLTTGSTPQEFRAATSRLLDVQTGIQTESVALLTRVVRDRDDDERTVRRALSALSLGPMLDAVKQAGKLKATESLDERPALLATLIATQDRILDVLRRLLNEFRKETSEVLAEAQARGDTQLPPEVRDKLRALAKQLEKFLDQQQKVIETTQELAKKPVDDFSERDATTVEDLAATEDEWSRFLAEANSDFSKLPEQDFSNPSLLEEMVAVETELKMARDALTRKAADIAVPLEQLGAEMAKEMTTNIEKWLPDSPDREKWSQEEPLTDDMKQAPMAELPRELEDIVGELMEEEEDLFEELEDASSSWADSLDKGAGWALDGPISTNSARGVTGNRLPNSSEIAGRSGEGRSGRSSGEFVGEEAIERRPKNSSRLAPDAFVKGQVKDTSRDPVGGATGGGKQSGVGGAGLQGPVPDRPEVHMARLAARQAALRNRAEGVDLKFRVMKYHHTDLKTLIGQMAAVESDLKAGSYHNALRRRLILVQGLDRVRATARGEYLVRKDQTLNLPAEIQKLILGSMQEPGPAGWDELNRRYFDRLAAPDPTREPQPRK